MYKKMVLYTAYHKYKISNINDKKILNQNKFKKMFKINVKKSLTFQTRHSWNNDKQKLEWSLQCLKYEFLKFKIITNKYSKILLPYSKVIHREVFQILKIVEVKINPYPAETQVIILCHLSIEPGQPAPLCRLSMLYTVG